MTLLWFDLDQLNINPWAGPNLITLQYALLLKDTESNFIRYKWIN